MNRPARATQAEIARALRAAKTAGPEYGVEVAPDGTIRIAPMPLLSPQSTGQAKVIALADHEEVIL